ncbi:ComEA family DNA-binding protein [Crocosphaera sp.]|uniref:ComEA family DNA-binding protein n=1 Tax=Crocosphaera sp. TaxID=2729996 RepID=UPI0026145EC1|nr:ComEA family DNA-binding protein [Crocosphaera sp.]MDJ0583297.1 ComEA family DNA-binding protein [Crocosphaera sp.]
MVFSSWSKQLNPRKRKLKQQIENDPYYRFQSLEEIAIATELGIKIDVTHATVDDLLRVPGISIHQARNLVELIQIGVEILSIEDMAAALNMPLSRLKPFTAILAFSYYDPDSLINPQKININTATLEDLVIIPNFSEYLKQEIISDRQQNGKYKNLVDLQKRLQLNAIIISELMHYISF